jgi:hypothetical protein
MRYLALFNAHYRVLLFASLEGAPSRVAAGL